MQKKVAIRSGADVDIALSRWLSARCASIEADVEFLLKEMEGPVAMPMVGHEGPADGKAWHRAFGDCCLKLKDAGVSAAERSALFPRSFPKTRDRDQRRMQRDREAKAAVRAKTRRKARS